MALVTVWIYLLRGRVGDQEIDVHEAMEIKVDSPDNHLDPFDRDDQYVEIGHVYWPSRW